MKTTTDLFILGAGASKSYGFPTGAELRNTAIDELIAGSSELMAQVGRLGAHFGYEPTDVMGFKKALEASKRNLSIDAFIESQVDSENLETLSKIAKVVISILVMRCEDEAKLDIDKSWYSKLFDKLYQGNNSLGRFFENKVQFITFNYDRSLERFLQKEVASEFNINEDQAGLRLKDTFRLIHIHGTIGQMWGPKDNSEYKAYITSHEDNEVIRSANKIRLITDDLDIDKEQDFLEARRLILEADRIHFIGFGYHPNNMRRLGLFDSTEMREMVDNKITGTVSKISEQDITLFYRQYKLNRYGGRRDSYSLVRLPKNGNDGEDGDTAFEYMDIAAFD